jgi:DoxX-like family
MRSSKRLNILLWVVQIFLALFFGLASGAPKLFLPFEMLGMPVPLPMPLVKLIGVAEVLGALGLILPGLLHTRPWLTPLAATGLVLLTLCATVYQLAAGQPANAVFAVVMGLIAASVAYGRWRLMPLSGSPAAGVVTTVTS